MKSNPSSWGQRIAIALIAIIAAVISLYLGLYQWKVIEHPWDPFFGNGTARVLDSDVSHEITKWIRIPDAVLGIFAYLSDAIFAIAGSVHRWKDRPWLVAIFGINVIPIGVVSIILVLMQAFVVTYWCFLCLMAALISLILIILAYNEVKCSFIYVYKIYLSEGEKVAWRAFWGDCKAQREEIAQEVLNVAKNR